MIRGGGGGCVCVCVCVCVFLAARILGEGWTINSPHALFFKVEICSRTLIPLFTPGSVHSGSASWNDCGRVFPDELRVSSFPERFPPLCLHSGIANPLGLRWVNGVCVFRCNLPRALLAEWPGSFTCHCGNTRVERTPNKSNLSTTSPALLPTSYRGSRTLWVKRTIATCVIKIVWTWWRCQNCVSVCTTTWHTSY